MTAVIAPATPLPTKLEWADCSCGHKSCKRAYPINFGTFYQGTGFEPHERAALDAAWNTRTANCHPELVEALDHSLATLQAIFRWVDRVNDAGGATSISGIASCNAMLKSLNGNRDRFQKLVVDPGNVALAKAKAQGGAQ